MNTFRVLTQDESRISMARILISAGFKSVSRKYRTLVRVPPEFRNDCQAFERWCHESYSGRPMRAFERLAKGMPARDIESFYCRVYGGYSFMLEHRRTLSREDYAAFKAAGGGTW